MTKQERLKAFEMRLDGRNWSEIGRELGYSNLRPTAAGA